MQRLEVSGAVRPIYGSLGVKRLRMHGHTNIEIVQHFVCSELYVKNKVCPSFNDWNSTASTKFALSFCPPVCLPNKSRTTERNFITLFYRT